MSRIDCFFSAPTPQFSLPAVCAETRKHSLNTWALAKTWAAILSGVWIMAAAGDAAAESGGAKASLNFRITIPAVLCVTPVSQPERIVISEAHIGQGYIDLDAATSIKLTNNTRDGFHMAARFDSQLLARVELRIADQRLFASAGFGSVRVTPGLVVDKTLPISYRLYLAPGVLPGDYHWPVALAFTLANA